MSPWGGDGHIQSDGFNETIVCDLHLLSKVKNISDKFCPGMSLTRYFYYKFFLTLLILYCLRFLFKFFLLQLAKQMKARKTHYLISTHQLPGVYNSPFYPPQPSAKEMELINARPLSRRSRLKQKSQLPVDAAEILNHSRSIKIVSRVSKSAPLPPIFMKTAAKVQVSEAKEDPMCSFIAQLVEHRTSIHRGHGFESR